MAERSTADVRPSAARFAPDESALDFVDVPAAVVCAACGKPDCPGCASDDTMNASGVVAIIPWERPGLGFIRKLWQTSVLATVHARTFFGALPDGEVSSALAFALVCETIAVTGLVLSGGLLALLFLPSLPGLLLEDPGLRRLVARGTASGILVLILAMVSVHAAHGVALDLAARRWGSRRVGQGFRFGLYACGWDLVTLPFGLLATALVGGLKAARRAAPLGLTAPLQAAEAYLVGKHQLSADTARRAARRAAYFTAAPLLCVLVAGASVVLLALR